MKARPQEMPNDCNKVDSRLSPRFVLICSFAQSRISGISKQNSSTRNLPSPYSTVTPIYQSAEEDVEVHARGDGEDDVVVALVDLVEKDAGDEPDEAQRDWNQVE
jgi:hypothetical protein